MNYFYIDESDGYIREFDNKGNFIPNENVAAFAPGPGFDWSSLKPMDSSGAQQSSSSSNPSSSANPNKNVIPQSVRKEAEKYAKESREKTFDQGVDDITKKSNELAKNAYVEYKKIEKQTPKNMLENGIYSDVFKDTNKAYANYRKALAMIEGNMEQWNEKLTNQVEAKEQKDIKDYINKWKEQRK